MPADIITTPAAIQAFADITVETKGDLNTGTAWFETPGLYANRLLTRVNGFDEATLYYAAGYQVARRDGGGFVDCPPLDLVGDFVRITVDDGVADPYYWHGQLVDDELLRGGVSLVGGERKYRFQDQGFMAIGLEYMLDRRRIDSAMMDDTRIGRSLVFNAESTAKFASSRAARGNRSSGTNSDSLYTFTATPGGDLWTGANIVEYLLKYFTPVQSTGAPNPVEWQLDVGAVLLLSDIHPTFNPSGMTCYQALNSLLSPQRGFCWWVEYDPAAGAGGQAIVHVDTLATADVSLPTGGTLPQNTDQKSVDFDFDPSVSGVKKFGNRRRRYNRVRVRGAYITSTFTVGFGDSTLEAGWSSATETAYKNAAKDTSGYVSLGLEEQEQKNDAYRRSTLLQNVYSTFRIPANWDKKCGDGGTSSPAVTRDWAFADTEKTGSILGSLPMFVGQVRVLPRTLLKTGVDYSNPSSQVDHNPAGTEPDLEPPLAFVKVATAPDKWAPADKLTTIDTVGSTEIAEEIKTSYHLYALQQAPGVRLRASSGNAHSLALNHFSGAEPTAREPELDYEDLIVTLSAEADTQVEGVWPAAAPTGVMLDELVIEAGDDYRLDFLAENTVVNVVAGDLVRANASTNAGRLLRDDREQLEDLARQAYEWYQTDRAGLQFKLNQTRPLFSRGTLITTVGDAETQETVNTVIGLVSYDFLEGTQQIATLGDAIDLPALLS